LFEPRWFYILFFILVIFHSTFELALASSMNGFFGLKENANFLGALFSFFPAPGSSSSTVNPELKSITHEKTAPPPRTQSSFPFQGSYQNHIVCLLLPSGRLTFLASLEKGNPFLVL